VKFADFASCQDCLPTLRIDSVVSKALINSVVSKSLSGARSEAEGKPKRLFLPATFLSGILFLAAASPQAAQSVTLAWNASSGPHIAGYRVHEGSSTRHYTRTINVGNATTATISDLKPGLTYYFVVSAYNIAGVESAYSNEVRFTAAATPSPAPMIQAAVDLNGDGHSDLVWFNQTTNQVAVWLMRGNSILAHPILGNGPANGRIVAVGNLNRTGNPQIIWYTGSNKYIAWSTTWSGSQPTTTATSFSLPTNFPTLAIANFDGDGSQDVVQWDPSSGKLSISKNNGSLNFTQQYSVEVLPHWDLVGVADLNGDGKHELVWRNQISGQVSAWVMNKFQPAHYVAYSLPTLSWRIRGIGKVDASRAQGLIWGNEETGRTSFWRLNTNGQVTNPRLPVGAAPWEIAGAPYFDGRNGLPEILWYNTQSGSVSVWRVNGTTITPSVIADPGTQWTIQPAVIGD
jgi:VCBS repeat protein/fibronectin type III domain protein